MVAALCARAPIVHAHPDGFSGLRIMIRDDAVLAELTLHTRDFDLWFPARKYPDYVKGVCDDLQRQAPDLLKVSSAAGALSVASARAHSPEIGMIQVDIRYEDLSGDVKGTWELEVASRHLGNLPRAHQQLLWVEDLRGQPPSARGGPLIAEETIEVNDDVRVIEVPELGRARYLAPTALKIAVAAEAASPVEHVASTTRPAIVVSTTSGKRPLSPSVVVGLFGLFGPVVLIGIWVLVARKRSR